MAVPSVASDDAPAAIVHRLIEDTDAALARQTLLQAASLPERADAPGARIDPNAPRWHFEIPFATAQGTAVARSRLRATVRARKRRRRSGSGGHGFARRRAERPRARPGDAERRADIGADVGGAAGNRGAAARRRAAARACAARGRTGAGDIVIGDGAPPRAAPPAAGHFLDRAL